MSKSCKEFTMVRTGQIYKFVGNKGVIRPDKFGQVRKDVLFNKSEHTLIIGDRVEYEHLESKGRIYAINLKKI